MSSSNVSGLGGSLDKLDFMNLLVAQMTNQNPLDPMDNTEFVAQLAQFSELEEMIDLGDQVETMALATVASTNAALASYLGHDVQARTSDFEYSGNPQDFVLNVADDANVTVTILDEYGDPVRTVDMGQLNEGEHSFTFDGLDDDGNPLENGTYTIEVTGTDADGDAVSVDSFIVGEVEGISYENGVPNLLVAGQQVLLGDIKEIL